MQLYNFIETFKKFDYNIIKEKKLILVIFCKKYKGDRVQNYPLFRRGLNRREGEVWWGRKNGCQIEGENY